MFVKTRPKTNLHNAQEALSGVKDVIVIGGSVAGAMAAYKLAREGLEVLCLDPRDVRHRTLPSCTGCGGLIQKRAVELLASVGIRIPDEIIRGRLEGYVVHMPRGGRIQVPVPMLAVYRGFGPLEETHQRRGFDAFLLQKATQEGVRFEQERVVGIQLRNGAKAQVVTQAGRKLEADMVVGAFGHNRQLVDRIEVPEGGRLDAPDTQKSAVYELSLGEEFCQEVFGNHAHVVVIPRPMVPKTNVWFAAFVPKDNGTVSVILMGRQDVRPEDAAQFFNSTFSHRLISDAAWNASRSNGGVRSCMCTRNTMTNRPPANYVVDGPGGMVLAGDAGPTRWGKDGIGAALDTGLATAQAIVAGDLGQYRQFAETHYPRDDWLWARGLLMLNDFAISIPGVEKGLRRLHRRQDSWIPQLIDEYLRHLLTGDIPYRKIPRVVMGKALAAALE
jgi:flavin-dependent dehydrogenase